MSLFWPTKFIKDIISVIVQTDKKRKTKRENNYFSTCLTSCRFKTDSNTKQYKIMKNSSWENYKAKRWSRDQRPQLLDCFHAVSTILFSPCPVSWNISGRLRNCMELSLWEYRWNTEIFKDRQNAQKSKVIWDTTKYIQKAVLIHNHQLVKEFEICSRRIHACFSHLCSLKHL